MNEISFYPNLDTDQEIVKASKNAAKHLLWYKKKIDPFINSYLSEKTKEASAIHPEIAVLVEELRRFVAAGGKRVRPTFAYAAYVCCGGRSLDSILYASSALEMLHAYALIHDDIIDDSNLRRGEPTVHTIFENFHKKRKLFGSASKFGISSAILVGDLAISYADELLNTAPFPAERIRRAKNYYDQMKEQVVYGQYLDVLSPAKKIISEKEMLTILEYKTAKYTIERPLHIGATLAGCDTDCYETFSQYGICLGQAFQIQDDIMGTFSTSNKIGKPVDSDIKEGKLTLLVIKALEWSSEKDKKTLSVVLGNKKASKNQVEDVRDIFRKTGSLRYSQELAIDLIKKAKHAVSDAKITSEGREILLDAADFLLTRTT